MNYSAADEQRTHRKPESACESVNRHDVQDSYRIQMHSQARALGWVIIRTQNLKKLNLARAGPGNRLRKSGYRSQTCAKDRIDLGDVRIVEQVEEFRYYVETFHAYAARCLGGFSFRRSVRPPLKARNVRASRR